MMVGMNALGFRGHKPSGLPQSGANSGNGGSNQACSLNNSGSADQTSFSNDLQFDTQPPASSPDDSNNSQGSQKGHGRDKSCQPIPPGLAKKKSSDLPDGNPWKAALAKQEKSSSSSGSGQTAPQPPANDTTDPAQTSSYDISDASTPSVPVQLLERLVELMNNLLMITGSQSQPSN